MVTYGFRDARLSVQFRSPHPFVFILVVALMLVPVAAAESDPNQYYDYDELGDYGIMPLDLTDNQSTWLKGIYDRLYYGGQSAAWFLNQLYTYIGHNPGLGSLQSYLNDIKNYIGTTNDRLVYSNNSAAYYLYSINSTLGTVNTVLGTVNSTLSTISDRLYYDGASLAYWSAHSSNYLRDYIGPALSDIATQLKSGGNIDSLLLQILEKIEAGNAKEWPVFTGSLYPTMFNGLVPYSVSDMPFQDAIISNLYQLQRHFLSFSGQQYLKSDGSVGTYGTYVNTFAYSMTDYFLGLARRLSADDSLTVFSFLPEDITQPLVSVSANNLLDALGIMGTQLQNPLQRLAYVFANPQDLEMRENVSDNTEEANEQFFKPGSVGSVSVGNIGDAAGVTSGLGGLLKSPVSIGDAWGQFNNDENYAFFSERTYHDLNTVNAPAQASLDPEEFLSQYEVDGDGFVEFYKPGNSALFSLLQGGG